MARHTLPNAAYKEDADDDSQNRLNTGTYARFDDVPKEPLNGDYEVTREDSFSMYIMFIPSGVHAKLVPLRRIDWRWNGTAQENANPPPAYNMLQNGKWYNESVPDSGHPEWMKTYPNPDW